MAHFAENISRPLYIKDIDAFRKEMERFDVEVNIQPDQSVIIKSVDPERTGWPIYDFDNDCDIEFERIVQKHLTEPGYLLSIAADLPVKKPSDLHAVTIFIPCVYSRMTSDDSEPVTAVHI